MRRLPVGFCDRCSFLSLIRLPGPPLRPPRPPTPRRDPSSLAQGSHPARGRTEERLRLASLNAGRVRRRVRASGAVEAPPPFRSTSVELIRAADAEEARETSGNKKSAGGERRRAISFLSPSPSLPPHPPIPSPRPLAGSHLSRPLISLVSGGGSRSLAPSPDPSGRRNPRRRRKG